MMSDFTDGLKTCYNIQMSEDNVQRSVIMIIFCEYSSVIFVVSFDVCFIIATSQCLAE